MNARREDLLEVSVQEHHPGYGNIKPLASEELPDHLITAVVVGITVTALHLTLGLLCMMGNLMAPV